MVDVLAAGYRLDRYELLCPIASGGMASVWLARLKAKRGFEKLFAVKTIKTELVADPRFQEMFLDEARLASRIEHPNVAQILDLGEKDEILYTVMEWVDGESLAKIHRTARERQTPIPPGVALRIMADVLAGLQAAHECRDEKGNVLGVVHRDVSPQNILLSSAGAVKVIDFGVAKAKNRIGSDTSNGAVKGKIRYLAPEQTERNADVDLRADLWAAAICLFELVAGKEPYAGLSDVDVLRKLASDDPAPPLHGLSENLVPIIPILDRALAKNPTDRYESAAAMRRALNGAMDELGLTSSSEEAADFLRTHLSDLEGKRRERVQQALDAANAANTGTPRESAPVSITDDEDVAYAPTIAAAAPSSTRELRTPLTDQLKEPNVWRSRTPWIAGAVLAVAFIAVFAEIHSSSDATPSASSAPAAASVPPPALAPVSAAAPAAASAPASAPAQAPAHASASPVASASTPPPPSAAPLASAAAPVSASPSPSAVPPATAPASASAVPTTVPSLPPAAPSESAAPPPVPTTTAPAAPSASASPSE